MEPRLPADPARRPALPTRPLIARALSRPPPSAAVQVLHRRCSDPRQMELDLRLR